MGIRHLELYWLDIFTDWPQLTEELRFPELNVRTKGYRDDLGFSGNEAVRKIGFCDLSLYFSISFQERENPQVWLGFWIILNHTAGLRDYAIVDIFVNKSQSRHSNIYMISSKNKLTWLKTNIKDNALVVMNWYCTLSSNQKRVKSWRYCKMSVFDIL